MGSEDQGYLPCTWEIQKSWMENQIVRAILCMFMHKISTRVIRVNGTCEQPWPRYFDGRKKEQFIPLLISYDRWRCRNVIKRRIIWHQLMHDFLKLTLLCYRWGRTRHVVLLWLVPVLHIWLAGRGNDSLGMFFFLIVVVDHVKVVFNLLSPVLCRTSNSDNHNRHRQINRPFTIRIKWM